MPRIFIVFNILEFLFAYYSIICMPSGGGGSGQLACLLAQGAAAMLACPVQANAATQHQYVTYVTCKRTELTCK